MTKRVVVTGLGVLSPIGLNRSVFWENLLAGVSGAGPITKFDASAFKTKFACELKGFEPELVLQCDKKELRKMDAYSIYALAACKEAVEHAKLDLQSTNLNRVGVIWASGNGGFSTFEEQVTSFAQGDGTPRFNPFFIPRVLGDAASGQISMYFGFRGINFTTLSACASSNAAFMDAFLYIKNGLADVIVTGGSDAAITQASIGGFNALKALSTQNEQPTTASRPFDKNRDGFVMGEGAATLILEDLEHAQRRGATIYAELVGAGQSADAYHLTATHPEGLGAKLAMQMALDLAGIQPKAIDYINAHATSTPVGDLSEINAIVGMFGKHAFDVHISATKSMTGHLLGAAGAIEAVASVLACAENKIPPTANSAEPDEQMPKGLHLGFGKMIEKEVHYAMSNTFGFGGHNAIAIFKKWQNR